MKRIILLNAIIVFTFIRVNAQQDASYSQYMFGDMAMNPGAAGSYDLVCITGIFRNQWTGFGDGNPENIYVNGNLPFKLFNAQHGAGFVFEQRSIGFYENNDLGVAYAYRFEVGQGKVGVGLGAGAVFNSLNGEWKYPDESGEGDVLVPKSGEQSTTAFDLDFGVFYRTDRIYAGVSTTHLNQGAFKYLGQNAGEMSSPPRMVRHYYLMGGYRLELNTMFDLMPSFMVESDGYANNFEMNVNILYNKKIWGGVSYKVGSAIIGMFGLELFKDVQVGYAYDFTVTPLRKYSSGSQELMLRYSFEIVTEKLPERYRSIRYLE